MLTFIPRTSTMTLMTDASSCGHLLSRAASRSGAQEGPKDAVVLIIRHAEDAGSGDGVSPIGQERAEAYKITS